MSVAHVLLGLLAARPMHGYELRAAFEERLGAIWSLNFGQVYPALDRLAEQGYVAVQREVGDGRDPKVYRITAAGQEELRRWLQEEPEPVRIRREDVFLRLAVATWIDPGAIPQVVARQRRVHEVSLAELVRIQGSLDPDQDPVLALVVEAAILRLEAELRWLERVEQVWPLLARRKTGGHDGRKE